MKTRKGYSNGWVWRVFQLISILWYCLQVESEFRVRFQLFVTFIGFVPLLRYANIATRLLYLARSTNIKCPLFETWLSR